MKYPKYNVLLAKKGNVSRTGETSSIDITKAKDQKERDDYERENRDWAS